MPFVFEKNSKIQDIITIQPKVFWDERWFFMETYHEKEFRENGVDAIFIQDNHSKSAKGVFRGFHFQAEDTQAKLVRVINGAILDFVIDIRKFSSTYGQYIHETLSAENKKQLFIPQWFAHWFVSLEDNTEFTYKCDKYYNPSAEMWIAYNDKDLNIDREKIIQKHNIHELILSEKDKKHPTLQELYEHNPF